MLYVLYESAVGYSLFEVKEAEEIGIELESVQVRCKLNVPISSPACGWVWCGAVNQFAFDDDHGSIRSVEWLRAYATAAPACRSKQLVELATLSKSSKINSFARLPPLVLVLTVHRLL
jgi:hypothetical protein